jgi:hypothetical protein
MPVEVTRAMETQLIINTGLEVAEDKNGSMMANGEIRGAAIEAQTDAAYATIKRTAEGTSEYDQALGDFISLLFPRKQLD